MIACVPLYASGQTIERFEARKEKGGAGLSPPFVMLNLFQHPSHRRQSIHRRENGP